MYKAGKHTLMKGTVHYMAPEILGSIGGSYDGKIDIWSVGCMIIEMWSGEKPWGADAIWVEIMRKVRLHFTIEFFIVEDIPLTAVGAADTPAPGREVDGGVVTRCS